MAHIAEVTLNFIEAWAFSEYDHAHSICVRMRHENPEGYESDTHYLYFENKCEFFDKLKRKFQR